MDKREFEYYAFISYSRADEKWAKWIQHKLETYRFPIALRREYQKLPAKIFPVFRDKTDLSSGVLWEQLKHQLEESEYLIVICSPASAYAEWVNQEITYFQSLGRNSNIIPVIVDGEPHAADSARECYAPALLNSGYDELLGVSVSELGRNMAILRVIASLMNLRYDQLVMRDRRRAHKQRIMAASLLSVLLVVAAGVLWYEIPHNSYYWSYVYQNEVPVGLVEINSQERKTAQAYYKIVTRQNRVVRLECVNSAGVPTAILMAETDTAFPVIEFSYNEEGELDSVTQKDAFGNALLIKKYSQALKAVDFKNPNDDTMIARLPSDLSSDNGSSLLFGTSAEQSEIVRKLVEYDENGFLIQELYMWDNRNTPACDNNGIYGKQYIRDEEGKILRVTNLGEDGKPLRMQHGTAIAFIDYEYDSYGRNIKSSVYDADGNPMYDEDDVFCYEGAYNGTGCLIEVSAFGTDGSPCKNIDGISQYRYKYDNNGFLTEEYYLNENGEAAYDKEYGVHRVTYENDQYGQITGIAFYDADNKGIICNYGYAGCSNKYDKEGRLREGWYYGLDGELTYASENYAGCTIEYLDDNTTKWTYYDTDGAVALTKYGYAGFIQKRNKQGLLVEETCFDTEGSPIRAKNNAASVIYDYDNAANLLSSTYLDENGSPCSCTEGFSTVRSEYDKDGNQISGQFYNAEGEPCYGKFEGETRRYSKWEAEYNSYGQITCLRYYDREGNLIYMNGVYETQMEYDERGNCIRYTYYDFMGNLINNSEGYAIHELTYNEKGEIIYDLWLDKNGSFITDKVYACKAEYNERGNLERSISYRLDENGDEVQFITAYEYDERDNVILEYFQDEDGRPCTDSNGAAAYEYKYNERSQLIARAYYDQNRNLINLKEDYGSAITKISYDEKNRISEMQEYVVDQGNSEQSCSLSRRIVFKYDAYGNQTEVWYYDSAGEAISDSEGIACTMKTYDAMGNSVYEVFYDGNGQPISCSYGYTARRIIYDAAGRVIEYDYLDDKGMMVCQENGFPAYAVKTYNDYGYIEEESLYNEAGEYFESEEYASHTVSSYDRDGTLTVIQYYDSNAQLNHVKVNVAYITEIEKGSSADLAGLQEFDIILQYGDWNFFGYEDFADTDFSELVSTISELGNQEKTVVVCRTVEENAEDGIRRLEFQKCTFEAGLTGVLITDGTVPLDSIQRVREQYETYEREQGSGEL